MAGLLYLPRLMVYHAGTVVGSESDATFKIMEKRLLRAIMTPAMLVSLLAGFGLVWQGPWWPMQVWLLIKLLAVGLLVVCHFVLARHVAAFAGGQRDYSARYFRILNEVPTLLMVVIVIFVIVKPFG
jgi:protoporphyrinogen IX oxidase